MISRIAAAFVLVFYIALLTDAGLEFLGLGDMSHDELGRDALLGADELDGAAGRVVAVLLPGRRARVHRARARARARRDRRGQQPAAARRADAARRRALRRSSVGSRSCGETHDECDRAASPTSRDARPRRCSSCAGSPSSTARRRRARRRRRPRDPRGRDPRARRRVRLRQDDGRERGDADPARRPARIAGGSILFRGEDLVGKSARGAAAVPLAERLDGLPERDERAQPGDARRRPVRRHDARARADRRSGGRSREAGELLELVGIDRRRVARVPARALGRHAPARDHRDGARAAARS